MNSLECLTIEQQEAILRQIKHCNSTRNSNGIFVDISGLTNHEKESLYQMVEECKVYNQHRQELHQEFSDALKSSLERSDTFINIFHSENDPCDIKLSKGDKVKFDLAIGKTRKIQRKRKSHCTSETTKRSSKTNHYETLDDLQKEVS